MREDLSVHEERIYGLQACLAVFRHRPQDVRKVYIDRERIPDVKELLRHCAKAGLAYKIVGAEDLERLTRSLHHEGIALQARPPRVRAVGEWLAGLEPQSGPVALLWLEHVRDPHNVGAILRSAAHFGARAVLLAGESAPRSAAWLRTAEGGAEVVEIVRVEDEPEALAALRAAGFAVLATSSHTRDDLYDSPLPARVVWLLGAEREGLSSGLQRAADQVLCISGTGAVESLNVATAAALLLAEHRRQHRAPTGRAQADRAVAAGAPPGAVPQRRGGGAARSGRRPSRGAPGGRP